MRKAFTKHKEVRTVRYKFRRGEEEEVNQISLSQDPDEEKNSGNAWFCPALLHGVTLPAPEGGQRKGGMDKRLRNKKEKGEC